MAQPIIVAGATAESGAAVGPVQLHGARPYSRSVQAVKRSESGDAAVQVVFVRALDLRGDDLAHLQRTAASEIDRAVDLRRVGLRAALCHRRPDFVDDHLLP